MRRWNKAMRVTTLAAALAGLFAPSVPSHAASTWQGGSGNWNVAGNWSPAGVPNGALFDVIVDGNALVSSVLTLNMDAAIGALTLEAGDRLIVGDGRTLTVHGVLGVAGSFEMASTFFNTNLVLGANVTLGGSGSVKLSNSGANRIYGATGVERLTIGVGQSIVGAGQIGQTGANRLAITNQGLIAAEGGNGLTFRMSSVPGSFNNTGGAIEVRDGSFASFNEGLFEGGTLRGAVTDSNTTREVRGSVNATLKGMNWEGSLTLRDNHGIGIGGTFSNTGTFAMNSVFFNTDMRVNEDATINGAGTIRLSNSGANRIYGATGVERLTIGSGQSIVGAGQIGLTGTNRLAITNQGLIAAEGGNGLTFRMASAAGSFNNTGGAIEVRDGSFASFNEGLFEGGTLRGAVTDISATREVRGSVTATLKGMNWEGSLTLRDNHGIGIGGTFSNTGTFAMNSVFFNTDMRVNEDAAINGMGTIRLSNSGANRIYGATGAERLTIGAGQSIVGAGQIGLTGANRLAITNQGLIAAEGGNGLTFRMASAAGSFNNTGGAIEVRDGSFASFNEGLFEGGTLRGAVTDIGATREVRGSTGATLKGMNWEGSLTLRDGHGIGIGGTFSNTGTFAMNSVFFNTDIRVNEDATINGAGTIRLSNSGANRIYGATGVERLTIGAGQSIVGAGQIGLTGTNRLAITNQGLIAAEGGNGLTFRMASAAGSFNNAGGVIEVRDGSFASFNEGLFEGGTLRGAVTDINAVREVRGSVNAVLSNMTLTGNLTLRDGNGVSLAGSVTNNATLAMNAVFFNTDLRLAGDVTLGGTGSLVLSNSTANRIYGSAGSDRLTVGAGQTLRGAGQLGVNQMQITNQGTIIADRSNALTINPTAADPFVNRGTVRVETGSQLVVSGSNLSQDTAGAATVVRGTLTVPQVDLVAGVLSGTGTVVGAVVNTGGTVAPGASPGKLVIQGNYVQSGAGNLAIEIDGDAQGVTYDWLSITGNASLGGTLTLSFGYTPVVGSSFVILTTGTGNVSGTFSSIVKPSGWDVYATYHAKDVTLTVAAVPEPETWGMLAAGLGLVGWAARRRRPQIG